jgi:hypothetical protein
LSPVRQRAAEWGYNFVALAAVTDDHIYRELALHSACDAVDIELAGVEFGERDRQAAYSWLCFVVDPESDDHAARNTMSTASDHFALIDPNGIRLRWLARRRSLCAAATACRA